MFSRFGGKHPGSFAEVARRVEALRKPYFAFLNDHKDIALAEATRKPDEVIRLETAREIVAFEGVPPALPAPVLPPQPPITRPVPTRSRMRQIRSHHVMTITFTVTVRPDSLGALVEATRAYDPHVQFQIVGSLPKKAKRTYTPRQPKPPKAVAPPPAPVTSDRRRKPMSEEARAKLRDSWAKRKRDKAAQEALTG